MTKRRDERAKRGAIVRGKQIPAQEMYAFVGYAFYRAWSFASFHSGMLLPVGQGTIFPRDLWLGTVAGTIVTLAIVLFALRRVESVRTRPFCLAAILFTCVSTIAVGVFSRLELGRGAILSSSVLFGVGSACMTLYWGESFTLLDGKSLWRILPGSFLLGVLITYALLSLPWVVTVSFLVALPLISVMCGNRLRQWGPLRTGRADGCGGTAHRRLKAVKGEPRRVNGLPFALLYNSFIFGLALGYLRGIGAGGEEYASPEFYEFAVVAVFMACLVVFGVLRGHLPSEDFLYRFISFGVIVAFLLLCLSPAQNTVWVFSLVMGCFEVFLIVWWIVMARYALQGAASPCMVFATGRLAIVFGMLAGAFLGGSLGVRFDGISMLIVALLVSAVFVLAGPVRLPSIDGAPKGARNAMHGTETIVWPTINVDSKNQGNTGDDATGDGRREQFAHAYGLTRRETEVAALLVQGFNASSIAKRLTISENTVKSHIKNIYKKVEVTGQQELLDRFHEAD